MQRLDVADMREQIAEREARLQPPRKPGSLVVAAGDGHARRCSRGSAPHVVDGGPTLNPSTYEILAGIHEVPAEEVLVLPELAERDPGGRGGGEALARSPPGSFPRRSQQAALAALVELDPDADAATNAERLEARRWRRSAPAPWRRPPATTPRAASSAATRSASPARRSSPGAAPASTLSATIERSPRAPRSSP